MKIEGQSIINISKNEIARNQAFTQIFCLPARNDQTKHNS